MKLKRAQKGIAAVELAIVLPLFLLLCFAIIEWSLLLYDKAIITNASREAVRAGIVFRTPKLTDTQIQGIAMNYCAAYLITLGKGTTPTVTVNHAAKAGFTNPLAVTVTYSYGGLGLGALLKTVSNSFLLSATAVMNNE